MSPRTVPGAARRAFDTGALSALAFAMITLQGGPRKALANITAGDPARAGAARKAGAKEEWLWPLASSQDGLKLDFLAAGRVVTIPLWQPAKALLRTEH